MLICGPRSAKATGPRYDHPQRTCATGRRRLEGLPNTRARRLHLNSFEPFRVRRGVAGGDRHALPRAARRRCCPIAFVAGATDVYWRGVTWLNVAVLAQSGVWSRWGLACECDAILRRCSVQARQVAGVCSSSQVRDRLFNFPLGADNSPSSAILDPHYSFRCKSTYRSPNQDLSSEGQKRPMQVLRKSRTGVHIARRCQSLRRR
jgi:hypothetical protein